MRFRRNLIGATALAVTLALAASACGSDEGSSADTTAGGGAETTAAAAETTAAGADTTGAPTGKCEAGTGEVPPVETATADGAGKTVGLLFDVTGRGDKSFNDSAAAALDKAKADFGVATEESAPTAQDGSDRPERMQGFVGDDLIVAVGFLWGDATTASAAANPTQKYAIVDSVVNTPEEGSTTVAPNVRSMVFAEQEGSFLVGAAAACASPSGKLGFIGGVENDLIKKFEAGYVAGATQVNPDIEVEVSYISQPPDFTGFNDAAKGKEIGASMFENGADIVYAAAGGSGDGMFAAAQEYSEANDTVVCGIGVDSDQILTLGPELEPYVMTSMLKRVDVAVYGTIGAYLSGELAGGTVQAFDLSVDGVGYSTTGGNLEDIVGDLDDLKQQIIDGDITVPTTP
jgi:basic membrane protein A